MTYPRKLTDDQVKTIVRRISGGETHRDVAAAFGVSKSRICQLAKVAGVKCDHRNWGRPSIHPETRERILTLVREGVKPMAIAAEFGVSDSYVKKLRREL